MGKMPLRFMAMASVLAVSSVLFHGMVRAQEHQGIVDCVVCHDYYDGLLSCSDSCHWILNHTPHSFDEGLVPPDHVPIGNIRWVENTINYPTVLGPVKFTAFTWDEAWGPPDGTLADGNDAKLDGPCEVCHTETAYHTNFGDGTEHYDDVNCLICHPHFVEGHDWFEPQLVGPQSHDTHLHSEKGPKIAECMDCHDTENYILFADGQPLDSTSVCDDCHSPGGAFDGVGGVDVGAKENWAAGIYEENGLLLKPGKEEWCTTCHDDEPAFMATGTSGAELCDVDINRDGQVDQTDIALFSQGFGTEVDAQGPPFDGDSDEDGDIDGSDLAMLASEYGTADCSGGSAGEVVFAPNISGDNLGYGFYVTGHKIACTSCHDADKNHVDGLSRTYEVANDNTASQSVVHPYNTGYRLKDGAMTVPSPAATAVNWQYYTLCFGCHNRDEVLGLNQDRWDVSHTNFWDSSPTLTYVGNDHTYHLGAIGVRADTDWDGVEDSKPTCISCHNVHGSTTRAMIRHGELISTPGTTDKVPALNFTYLVPPAGPGTATWTASGLAGGTYTIEVHIPSDPYDNHAGDASYTVSHDGSGSPTVVAPVDQRIDGGVWVSLGSFAYNPGSSGTVVLDNNFTIRVWVVADAVRWVGGTPSETIEIDNPAASFSPSADWLTWSTDPGTWHFIGTNFRYTGPPKPVPADVDLEASAGGWMRHGGTTVPTNHVCRTCHVQSHTRYERAPKLWPKVFTTPGAVPGTVPNDGTGSSVITVTVVDPDNNVSTVTIDLSSFGGSSTQSMTDNGNGTWSYTLNVALGTTQNPYPLHITATDGDSNTGRGIVTVTIIEPSV